ncbi:hypothetical protein [Myroides odoratimimus]|uniref:hypothetical protein n=1 Tax=Myroides odoratimimus TaxID=76832 RepID=UPI00046B072F|nr:hypothetical protein [Myroides odoratimimus]
MDLTFSELLILSIIISICSILATAYLKKKGANLAQKEDLQYLTKIVEDIKKDNSKELEFLKSGLNRLSEKEKMLFIAEKEALVEFNLSAMKLLVKEFKIDFLKYLNGVDIIMKRDLIDQALIDVRINFSKLELLCNNQEVVEDALNYLVGLNAYKDLLDRILNKYTNVVNNKFLVSEFINQSFEKNKEDFTIPQEIRLFSKELESSESLIKTEFYAQSQVLYDDLVEVNKKFLETSRIYLSSFM